MKRMRLVLLALAVMLVLGAFAGCADTNEPQATESGGVVSPTESKVAKQITFWHSYTQPERIDAMEKIAAAYKEKTGIEVVYEVIPWGGVAEKWRSAFAAGTLPDAVIVLPEQMLAMNLVGASIPVDDIIKEIGEDRFLEGTKNSAYYDGHYIGIPHYAHCRLAFYRKSRFEAAGLGAPTTLALDELVNDAAKVNNPPDSYGFVQLLNPANNGPTVLLSVYMQATGAEYFDANMNVNFNTPETKKAVQAMIDLYNNASVPGALDYQSQDIFTLMNTGLSTIQVDTAFVIASALRDAPDVAADIGVASLPGSFVETANIVQFDGDMKEETADFIKFMYEDDNYINFLWSMTPGMNPVLKDILDPGSKYWENEKFDVALVKEAVELQNKGIADGYSYGQKYGPNPYASILVSGPIGEMIHSIILDGVSVDEAVATCDAKLKELVEEQKAAANK